MNNINSFNNYTTNEKIEYLKKHKAPNTIINYLADKFKYLKIKICNSPEENIMNLMNNHSLERWCWQTTETAILFLDDDSYIERGILTLNKNKKYYHSWIFFLYNNENYIFDPCLNIITKKDLYYQVFDIELKGKVQALKVKEYINKYLNSKEEVIINGKKDINNPIYGNNDVGYKIEQRDNKSKVLIAHYHLNRYKK
ncbi:MAG: hypothetical protein VZS44_01775 [Bacilli bacterium]|nr:hypothetical protein [Bacilli bacterium]